MTNTNLTDRALIDAFMAARVRVPIYRGAKIIGYTYVMAA